MKRGKKIMLGLKIVFGIAVILMLTGALLQATYFKGKHRAIAPYGQMVGVKDGQMHLYTMGDGDQTIVLLPGMGVGLPSADFAPLMRKLSEAYTVVTVEYFGVGFSSQTERPRTTENYVEEIREALDVSGLNGPFILMPHSISSVYSEYYATRYPEEVMAIVSLDGTSTAFYEEMPSFVKYILPIAKLQQSTGTMSVLGRLTTNKKKLLSTGYTEKEIDDMLAFAGFSMNKNLLEQIATTADHVKAVKDLPFPESVAYYKVISKKTYETPNKQLKMTPQAYQEDHLKRIGTHAKYEILEGNHFIYWNNQDRIAQIVAELLLGGR